MSTRLLADYAALTRAAAAQRASRNALIRVQHARRDARLDPDALGRILPAREIVATFGDVDRATRVGLWDVAHRCEDLSDAIREIRNLFRAVDEEAAERFETLGASLAEVGR